MTIDMSQFIAVFFDEAAEHLASLEALLLKLNVANPDAEELNAIFRAAHSIKGGAATFGFSDLTEVTHILENLLDRIRKHETVLRPEMVDVFLRTGDVLQDMLAAHRGQGDADAEAIVQVTRELAQFSNEDNPASSNERISIEIAAGDEFDMAALLRELTSHGEIIDYEHGDNARPWRFRIDSTQMSASILDSISFLINPERISISEGEESDAGYGLFTPAEKSESTSADEAYGFFEQITKPEETTNDGYGFFEPLPVKKDALVEGEGFGFFVPAESLPIRETVVPQAEVAVTLVSELNRRSGDRVAADRAPAGDKSDTSIRVSVEKVDQLLNLVGELVITQSMLAQNALQLDPVLHEKLLSGVAQLERNTRELQESVMSIRMMPISFVFNRYPRLVRDLAGKLNKQVELRMIGENTELDKGFIEKLSDPMTHLVRNSLDHGLETPEVRLAKGKPAQGNLTLKAFHQGGNIVIEVSDDGAGLNRERILAKAKERGFNVSDSMPDSEVWMLIFEAGFSTAAEVTDVSGRGVGMDVVRKNIQSMGGRVEIQSMAGVGSTISVRLPLTLAILDGMSIAASDELYIIPLTFIIESLQPRVIDIKGMAGRGNVINVRGEYLPLIALYEIFNLPSKVNSFEEGIAIILEAEGQKIALFVDNLLGQHQVVVKNLETNYRRVPGVAGATIMGDGHVAFILDVAALVQMAQQISPPNLIPVAA
ncbi:chemotaxis protein CheW [Deefgea tanakiae]|uniref:Chemotaxis protein CheA n=1 Tax=Deefgea tanakiae TaxID=2865840 RepID=A0ABX8Z6A0_9NEIS|nr:chemotaxis protein CheW [Deefgea tanakiae]QZA78093.1 chemotaxis protein CheW [Deefgea tanakiae]